MIFSRKINLLASNPKGCKLIFNTPFRAGENVENKYRVKYFNKFNSTS